MFSWFCQLFCGQSAANAQPIDLKTGDWRIKMEDNNAFATPQYDDSTWQQIAVGQAWESTVGNYDGIAWYRKSLVLDRKLLRKAVRCGGGMVLRLGKIDDADETYFNGVKIRLISIINFAQTQDHAATATNGFFQGFFI